MPKATSGGTKIRNVCIYLLELLLLYRQSSAIKTSSIEAFYSHRAVLAGAACGQQHRAIGYCVRAFLRSLANLDY
jgi:hypothetical protein